MLNIRMYCRVVLPALICLLVIANNAFTKSRVEWPSAISNLNGWNGFKLVKGVRCRVCYSLVIPKTFGLKNEEELRLLVEIPDKRNEMKYDLDGPLFDDRDVLDHLLRLALDNGDVAAGRVVLNPKKYGMLIGAETSEDIEGTYIIPLIRGYKDLQALIDASDYKNLAQRICNWSAEEHDFRAANDLILELTHRKNLPFASSLSTKCRAKKQLMRKRGEEFTE